MIIGYARVSTQDQKLDLQINELEKAGCERVFSESVSGVTRERRELIEAVKILREGDVFVIWKLDRLGRSVRDLVEFANMLNEKGVFLKSISDSIDTSTPSGKFFFHITASFAEFERNLIRERTMAGLKAAREKGRLGGRPRAIDAKTFDIAKKMKSSGDFSVAEICRRLNIKKRSFYRYIQEEAENQSLKVG